MRDYDALIAKLQHAQANDSEPVRLTLISELRHDSWATAQVIGAQLATAAVDGNWLLILQRSLLLAEQAKRLAETRN